MAINLLSPTRTAECGAVIMWECYQIQNDNQACRCLCYYIFLCMFQFKALVIVRFRFDTNAAFSQKYEIISPIMQAKVI